MFGMQVKNMRRAPVVMSVGAVAFVVAQSAAAVCPVCTVAVGAGVGLSRWLGVDDTVTGTWIGALTVSLVMWTNSWLEKKGVRFFLRDAVVAAGYVGLVVLPLWWSDIIGHPFNTLWGVDKLFLGMFAGAAIFYVTALWYERLKTNNNGRSYFPFQKVVMPVAGVAIASLAFYLITR